VAPTSEAIAELAKRPAAIFEDFTSMLPLRPLLIRSSGLKTIRASA